MSAGRGVTDLTPLSHTKLIGLYMGFSAVTDLRPISNLPLQAISLKGAKIKDYSVLTGLPLEQVNLDYKPELAATLKNIRTLRLINNKPVTEVFGK